MKAKRIITIALAVLMTAMFVVSVSAAQLTDVDPNGKTEVTAHINGNEPGEVSYIITIPATLDVQKAGWNDSEGISASGSLAAGKKLTVTASSDGEFALVNTSDNAEKIRYKLVDVASEDAEYYMTSENTVWEFTTLSEDADRQQVGVVVDDYSKAAPGSEYIDTVTFTASVVDAQ